jgi:hypothetical protein
MQQSNSRIFTSFCITISMMCATPAMAQLEVMGANAELPQVSPAASVSQRIGLTDMEISYNRPGVKGRDVWGPPIVPFNGEPYPWRAGANKNTTISFSTDVTVEGELLAAGTYGFHIIPSDAEWTLIFSNDNAAWGSYAYNPENDALRVTVTPEESAHREWLAYGFSELTADSCEVFLEWETKRIPFQVGVDLGSTVVESLREQLMGSAGFTWNANYQAAKWCLDNEVNLEEALTWAERSIQRNKNDFNLRVKGQILAALDRDDEARDALEEALAEAPEKRREAIENDLEAL